jgi:mono/diheme cytochrome c family protein
MEPVMRNAVFALFVLSLSAPALADEQPIDLKKAPGLDVVEGNCAACHSLDYVQMNSPFLNAAGWDAEVSKMIKLFGAPISDEDAKKIADYLKANYGVN